jgi:hypothetical protein
MPCTLEPWEVEFEERRINRETFKREITDAELLEEVACSACRTLERLGRLSNAPGIVRKWWRLHKQEDRKKGK